MSVPGRNGPRIASVTLIGWMHALVYCICEYTRDESGLKQGIEVLIKHGLLQLIRDEVNFSS